MSQLLHSILSSKLAQASLSDQKDGQDGHNEEASGSGLGHDDSWEEVHTSDEEIIGVSTPAATVPGTPLDLSRPSTPGMSKTPSLSGAGVRTKSGLSIAGDRPVRIKAPKSKTDPLRSLPKNVSQRIFLSLRTRELLALSCVCKRYRRSATLNYCWYRQCQAQFDSEDAGANSSTTTGGSAAPAAGPAGSAHWTRRESKTDWKLEYIKRLQRANKDRQREDGIASMGVSSGYTTPSRTQRIADSGGKTARDVREEQWQQEEAESRAGYTKNEMRAFYKEQGGSKGGKAKGVKSKSGKGGSRAGADDLWE